MKDAPSQRILWVDVAKGIAIVAVVVSHTGFLPFSTITSPFIGSWMLPIFAFVGGYVYTRKLRVGRLFFAYFVAGVVSFAGWLYLREAYPQGKLLVPVADQVSNFIFGKNLVFNGPLWFLPAYFLTTTAIYLLYPVWKKQTLRTQLIGIAFAGGILSMTNALPISFPFSLDLSLLFFVFFLAGIVFREVVRLSTPLLLTIGGVFLGASYLNGTVDLFERSFGSYLLFWLSAFSGIVLVCRLAQLLSRKGNFFRRFFAFSGRHSLLILVTHWPVIQWVSFFLYMCGIVQKIGANPTITSFWLPHTGEPVLRLYVILFLLLYLTAVFGTVYFLQLTYCKLFAIIKRLWMF